MLKLTKFQKFKAVCHRYNVYYDSRIADLEGYLIKHVAIKAADLQKKYTFETFIRKVFQEPVAFLYQESSFLDDVLDLNAVNNCFNDKNKIHYGLKYKGRWFFISHSGGSFSKALFPNDFKIKNKETDSTSYLVSYDNVMPNPITYNIGTIKTNIIEEYITKFL